MAEPHDHGGHAHGHDHHGHDEHDHSHDLTPALQSSLYQQIDFEAVNTLNECQPKSGAAILKKTWAQRLDAEPELESDADEQLLMHVPFVPISFGVLTDPLIGNIQLYGTNQAARGIDQNLELGQRTQNSEALSES